MADCVKCTRAIETNGTGRPAIYCSVPCRRSAEFEIRRLVRRLEKLEDEQRVFLRRRGYQRDYYDDYGRSYKQAKEDTEREIHEAEQRLRLLVSEKTDA